MCTCNRNVFQSQLASIRPQEIHSQNKLSSICFADKSVAKSDLFLLLLYNILKNKIVIIKGFINVSNILKDGYLVA